MYHLTLGSVKLHLLFIYPFNCLNVSCCNYYLLILVLSLLLAALWVWCYQHIFLGKEMCCPYLVWPLCDNSETFEETKMQSLDS